MTHDITIHAFKPLSLNVGGGNPPVINAETFGGTIPGTFDGTLPGSTLILDVDDTLIVRLINDLPYPTGIHWHGIELENYSDGTEVTQSEVQPPEWLSGATVQNGPTPADTRQNESEADRPRLIVKFDRCRPLKSNKACNLLMKGVL